MFPLDIDGEPSMVIPPLETGSPSSVGSGSSGPPSPQQGPFTPTNSILANSFAQLTTCNSTVKVDDIDANPDMELEVRLQPDLDNFDPYAWINSSGLWPTSAEVVIGGDDFDLDTIPAADFGIPK